MLKKYCVILLLFCFILPQFALFAYCEGELCLSASSAVLMNADTLEVIYSLSPDEKRGMASTTKIMTSLLALEFGSPDAVITATEEAVTVEGTSIGLLPGDKITVKNLVFGMLLESGNDAANVTAYAVSGNITEFCRLMNKRAKELGMNNTHFANPSGLPNEKHYSTAYDMALLASFAINVPQFRNICSLKSATVSYGTPEYKRTFTNHNKLLSLYDGCIGLKTGFTKSSGRCLVSAAEKDGVTLVAVTLNAPDDWEDHRKMLDYGFSECKKDSVGNVIDDVSVRVVGSDVSSTGVYLADNNGITSFCEKSYHSKIYVEPFLYAPVKAGDTVGKLVYYDSKGNKISGFLLFASDNAEISVKNIENSSFIKKIINIIKDCLNG